MAFLNFISIYLILKLVTSSSCWQFFTSLSDFNMVNSHVEPVLSHSEYYFGHCKDPTIIFYTHQHFDALDVLGKVIVRGWLDLYRIPTCIVLRATAFEEDTFRSTSYNFQVCVPRLAYCHSKHRYLYYYYEWYIPVDMIGGMNWDMYFFGPESRSWG